MKVWEVKYTHIAEFEITAVVEAETEEEAIGKASIGDNIEEHEEGPEWVETKDYRTKVIEEIVDENK